MLRAVLSAGLGGRRIRSWRLVVAESAGEQSDQRPSHREHDPCHDSGHDRVVVGISPRSHYRKARGAGAFIRVRDSYIRACGKSPECNFPDPITIPAGHWFLMGDNRGEVPRQPILGTRSDGVDRRDGDRRRVPTLRSLGVPSASIEPGERDAASPTELRHSDVNSTLTRAASRVDAVEYVERRGAGLRWPLVRVSRGSVTRRSVRAGCRRRWRELRGR